MGWCIFRSRYGQAHSEEQGKGSSRFGAVRPRQQGQWQPPSIGSRGADHLQKPPWRNGLGSAARFRSLVRIGFLPPVPIPFLRELAMGAVRFSASIFDPGNSVHALHFCTRHLQHSGPCVYALPSMFQSLPVSRQSAVKPRLLFQPPSVHHIEFRRTLSRIRAQTRLINHWRRRPAIVESPLRRAIRVPKLYPEPLRCPQLTLIYWRKSRSDLVVHEVQLKICGLCLFEKAPCLLRIWPGPALERSWRSCAGRILHRLRSRGSL